MEDEDEWNDSYEETALDRLRREQWQDSYDDEPRFYDYVDTKYDEGYYEELDPIDIPEKGEQEYNNE